MEPVSCTRSSVLDVVPEYVYAGRESEMAPKDANLDSS